MRLTDVAGNGMSGEPAAISSPHLIFFNQSVRALWIVNWLQIPRNLEKSGAISESYDRTSSTHVTIRAHRVGDPSLGTKPAILCAGLIGRSQRLPFWGTSEGIFFAKPLKWWAYKGSNLGPLPCEPQFLDRGQPNLATVNF
jgi:hypothetical protein